MPSTPPRLPDSPSCLASWWVAPPGSRSGEPSRTEECRSARGTYKPNRINWSAILASTAVSFSLVVGVLSWIVTHPHKAVPPLQMTSGAADESPAEPAPSPSHHSPIFSATPAFHRPHSQEAIAKNIPLVEEDPPPLPSPSCPQPPRLGGDFVGWMPGQMPQAVLDKTTAQPLAGETYGTQVLFHNNQAVAADLARHEHKLLFVMHISGNFEDSCFT